MSANEKVFEMWKIDENSSGTTSFMPTNKM
jgi:hypothetical protein